MADDVNQLFETLEVALGSGGLRRIVLSQPTQRTTATATRIDIRPVTLRQQHLFQWSSQIGSQVFHENQDPAETLNALQQSIGHKYRHIHVMTQDEDWAARFSRRGKCRLKRQPRTVPAAGGTVNTEHNRQRPYLIPEGTPVPFLIETGIMTTDGHVRSRYSHKFRQINRYVEFIADIVKHLPSDDVIRVVDSGSGKSYLTFAVHYYLTEIVGRRVWITGLDRRSDVVQTCIGVSKSLGLSGIRFEEASIAAWEPDEHVHLAISLHACDTATDDALAQAVQWGSDVILAVPCCQHELSAAGQAMNIPLLSRYGILRERFCSMATDAVRAALLEQVGYQTQVVEFIDMEHTAKNLLIRAIRRGCTSVSADRPKVDHELQKFYEVFQVPTLHLQRRLQEMKILFSERVVSSE